MRTQEAIGETSPAVAIDPKASVPTRIPFGLALLAVVVISSGLGWALSHAFEGSSARPAGRISAPHHLAQGWSYVAVARTHRLVVYRSADSRRERVILRSPNGVGVPLTLLVRRAVPRWIETYLPVRPNLATGWVRLNSVTLLTTAYALSVHLRTHRLLLLIANRVVRNFRIGVGQAVTPTPSGTYFITELLKQPDPGGVYGPYALGLSAHSGVLRHFGRGGDGQIGIHGTNEPQWLGTDVSHGCIRMLNRDITWLAGHLPLGTPVTIDRA